MTNAEARRWLAAGGLVGAILGAVVGCRFYGISSSGTAGIAFMMLFGAVPGAVVGGLLSYSASRRLDNGTLCATGLGYGLLVGVLIASPFLLMSPLFGLLPLSYTATCGAVGGLITPLLVRRRWVLWSGTVALALFLGFLGTLNPPKSALRQRYERALAAGDGRIVREALDEGLTIQEHARPRENTFVPDLTLAVMGGSVDTVKLLLDRGADPNALGAAGSPLERAAGSGNLEIARLLISHGSEVTGQHSFMQYAAGSPLGIAVYSGDPRMVRLLLQYCPPGSDELRDEIGHPLSEWARERGKTDVARLLEAHAAKADRVAPEGR